MLIDGFTVAAQIVNFLILIWLLNRFLFRPIRRAMAQREQQMADALHRAEQAAQQAQAQTQALAREKAALANARDGLMVEARKDVDRWRQAAMDRTRNDVASLRQAWMSSMSRERQAFLDRLKRQVAQQVLQIGDKTLRDLSGQGLNRQVLRVFLEKVSDRRDELNTRAATREVVVQYGFPLDDQDAGVLKARLAEWFPAAAPVRFESHPELGLGIQLVVGDRTAAWHLADYLQDLETDIMANLVQNTRTHS